MTNLGAQPARSWFKLRWLCDWFVLRSSARPVTVREQSRRFVRLDSARARLRRVKCKQGSRSSVMGAEVSPCCALGVAVPWALRLEMRTQPSRAAVLADRHSVLKCDRATDIVSPQRLTLPAANKCTARTVHACASLPALVRGQGTRMPAARRLRRTSRQLRSWLGTSRGAS